MIVRPSERALPIAAGLSFVPGVARLVIPDCILQDFFFHFQACSCSTPPAICGASAAPTGIAVTVGAGLICRRDRRHGRLPNLTEALASLPGLFFVLPALLIRSPRNSIRGAGQPERNQEGAFWLPKLMLDRLSLYEAVVTR